MEWLEWKDPTEREQNQAKESYKLIRSMEEGVLESEIDVSGVYGREFERMDDGYIYVNL